LDGQVQAQLTGWEQLCWYSDDDVDYIEIEAKFGDSCKLQRQAILLREHRLVFLADALLCHQAGTWELEARLPVAHGLTFESSAKNWEGQLQGSKTRSVVIPLYMPEWRAAAASGCMTFDHRSLLITNRCQATHRIYSPVVVSLCNRHADQPLTWRQLTVAEDLRIVRRDEAVAYRFQIGKQQYAIYRNLSEAKKRTFLGVHALCEFYAGCFDRESGDCDTLIEVELNR
jgi:hypothetical protein